MIILHCATFTVCEVMCVWCLVLQLFGKENNKHSLFQILSKLKLINSNSDF